MQGSSNEGSGARLHRGRGENRPCDFCRMGKTRCLVKDSLPCEKCKRASRACTFNQEPRSRRRQQPEERNIAETGSPVSTLQPTINGFQYLVPQAPGAGFGAHSSGAVDGAMMDFDFNWDFFQTQSTPNAFSNLPDNSVFNGGFPSRSLSHPSLSDTAQSPNPLVGPSPGLFQISGIERIDAGQDKHPNRSRVLLSASSEMDPFLRSFYAFDDSHHFQSSLRSFKSFSSDPASPTLFVETLRRVTDAIADNLVSQPYSVDPLIQEMEPYRAKLLNLFGRFIYSSYPVCQSTNHTPMSPPLTAAIYGMALPGAPMILPCPRRSLTRKE